MTLCIDKILVFACIHSLRTLNNLRSNDRHNGTSSYMKPKIDIKENVCIVTIMTEAPALHAVQKFYSLDLRLDHIDSLMLERS